MNKELSAKDIFGRTNFRGYSEFYLALAMGKILRSRGYCLNMDGMQVDADCVPDNMIKYYKKLLNEKAISLSLFNEEDTGIENNYEYDKDLQGVDIDISYFSNIVLAEDNGATLDWSYEFAKENYGEYRKTFLEFLKLGLTLVHLVAYHLVSVILDGNKKKLILHFDSQKSDNTFLYINIYSCLHTINWINNYVGLDLDLSDSKNKNKDLDYMLFFNNGLVAGHYKLNSVSEKLALLKKYGMVEGSILELWSRGNISKDNKMGTITGVTIIRLDEINEDFIGITTIALNRTKEEVLQDYYDIDESVRSLFVDMLGKKPNMSSTELNLYNVGIDNHFLDEDKYITLIDEYSEVYKLITIDGKVGNVKMTEVDAIYWLLCQYDIEFDRELYKKMYFHDKEPLWDMYN